MGNVIFTPHPVTLEGQRRESLVPGETVRELLVRVAPEAPPEEWQVHVDGNPVRPEEYDRVRPPEGSVIEVRGIVQRQVQSFRAVHPDAPIGGDLIVYCLGRGRVDILNMGGLGC